MRSTSGCTDSNMLKRLPLNDGNDHVTLEYVEVIE